MTTIRRTMSYAVRSATAVAVLALLAACSVGDFPTRPAPESMTSTEGAPARTLTVFAAASLQKPFEAIADDFESRNPGVTVKFNFAGSSGLVAQLAEGAPADVLATANEATMTQATDARLTVGTPTTFATNTLQIVVPQDNPAKITSLADLAKPGAKVVLCAPAVPCGAAATSVEKAAGIDIKPVSEEQAVTDVLGKVRSGEADAGLVYVTDVAGAGAEVTGIDFAEAASAINTYPIATLTGATDSAVADDFVGAVTNETGQQILREAGFAAP